jgi:hypothetical protein
MALITPWIHLDLDAYSIPPPLIPGWSFILQMWSGVWNDFIAKGFNLDMWPFWLLGFVYVLVLVYIILNIYLIATSVPARRNKTLSFILLGIAGIFLFPVIIGGRPMLGYWLINLALLSSAILEWMKADLQGQ